MSAKDRGWGEGWPKCQRDKIKNLKVSGISLPVRAEIAPLVEGFVIELVQRGYPVAVVKDDWGFACRAIAGTNTPSNHSWGLAFDINATTNPMGKRLITDMPSWVPEVAARYGFGWGGNYKTRPDAMHFEFMGTPQDVEIILWKLSNGTTKISPTALDYRGNLWVELGEDMRPDTVTDGCAVPDGSGTWRCTARGSVLSLQDAPILQDLPALNVSPNAPIMAIVPYSRGGAWLIGADGGIFALGDAPAIGGYLNIIGHIVGASRDDDGSLTAIASEGHAYNYQVN